MHPTDTLFQLRDAPRTHGALPPSLASAAVLGHPQGPARIASSLEGFRSNEGRREEVHSGRGLRRLPYNTCPETELLD